MTRYGLKVEKQSCSLASPRIGNRKIFGIAITDEAAEALFRLGVAVEHFDVAAKVSEILAGK